jgi:hypothetical protein
MVGHGGHDAEVSATATQCPKLLVLLTMSVVESLARALESRVR